MRLAFVGDVALGDHPKTIGFGFRSRYPQGIPASLAGRLLPAGPPPDLVLGNLEFCLGLEAEHATRLADRQCRGIDQYAAFLAAAGVTALNVANNHSAQHGQDAFWATVDLIRASGMAVVGTRDDFTERGTVPVGEWRIALLGWADHHRQYGVDEPPYNEFREDALERIREARQRADVVVASMHWGQEFVQVPAEHERRIGRAMIDAGASIVVGHHPHVLREIELYANGLIAYSVGNFIGDMTWNPVTRLGGCLLVDLDGPRVRSHHLALSRIASDYLPVYLSDTESARAIACLERQRSRQARRITRRGYGSVAAAEQQRQARTTGLMMARNLHRYPRGILLPMLAGALRSRLVRADKDSSGS